MRILFDQGTPAPLWQSLTSHRVSTAFEMGWSETANGELLTAAESEGFDSFVTTDKNLRYQQNLGERRIAILVLPFASWPRLRNHLPKLVAAIESLQPGNYVELTLP